ncbi:MAG: GGDEF domain-containing protein, partial [Lachnospiraceae bacterium]|nr:GGDEF domain-containing protein [Lachnospiraceae bacterium]
MTDKKTRILIGAYSTSAKMSLIASCIVCILEAFMIGYAILNRAVYGPYFFRYISFYVSFLILSIAFICINVYANKNLKQRYRFLNIANPIFAGFEYAWAILVTYSDCTVTGMMEPTLFMTFSLVIPLSFFLFPKVYALIAGIADAVLLFLFFYMTDVGPQIINIIVFIIFQFVLGSGFENLRLKLSEQFITEQDNANHDGLTGLYNRRSYTDALEALEDHIPDDFSYITVDVNSLKETNDTYGHAAGDRILIGVARCLQMSFSDKGKVYRIGGDEYAVLLHAEKDELERMIEDFKHHL